MLWNAFIIALREIRRNLMRAFLTVVGIVIGVAAVITMVTLGRGATESVKAGFSSLGSNLFTVRPGQGFGQRSASPGVPLFSQEDARAIRDQVPGIEAVAPVTETTVPTIYFENSRNTRVTGTTPDYFKIGNWKVADGRFFTETEVRGGDAVCIIGQTVRRELYGDDDPVGTKIRLRDCTMQVIGVLNSKGQTGFGMDQDDTVITPITTIQRRLTGRTSMQNINTILVSGKDDYPSPGIMADLTALMRERRNLTGAEENNFSVFDSRQIAEAVSASVKTMTGLLGAVAGVSLLVGGIGIMNIMLVSVTERTREIGIRMAIGSRAREVMLQFIVEAVTLSATGGVAGMLLAWGLCAWLSGAIGLNYQFDPVINAVSFVFSAAMGIIFGFMPARRASRLDPIDALRHE